MSPKTCECEHDFTLVLTGITDLTEEVEDVLLKTCDDATLAMRCGRPFLTFSRTSRSMKDAVLSAIDQVRKARINADILRVDYCNLVTQSDIARRICKSRQLVHQYICGTRGPGGFPPPACEMADDQFLWYWCEVAYWLWENNMVKESVVRDAQEVDVINCVLEYQWQSKTQPSLTSEVEKLLAKPPEAPTKRRRPLDLD